MAGYIDVVAGMNPTHYWPLNGGTNGYTVNDAIGSTSANPAGARGTNYKHFVNQGGVSFGTNAYATFNGALNSWMQAPTTKDFSICNNTNSDGGVLTVVFWVNFPEYLQGGSSNNLHFFAKGDSGGSNWMEWSMRLYGDNSPNDPGDKRSRGISNYYWNPQVDKCNHAGAAAVSSSRGSGAFMMPQEGPGTRSPNAPVGAGNPNTWHMIVATWGISAAQRATAHVGALSGQGTNTSTTLYGFCDIFYGSETAAMDPCSGRRGMRADACVVPYFTQGPLTLGRRVENSWTLNAKVRRVAMFNRELLPTEMEQLRQAHITYADTEGTLGAPAPGGGAFTPIAKTAATSGTDTVSAVTLDVPALTSTDLHVITGISNALASGNGFTTTPSGYTRATGSTNDNINATSNSATATFYRLGPAAANSALSVTANGDGRTSVTHVVVPDVASVQATTAFGTGAAGTTLTSPTLTPAATGRLLLTCWAARETVFSTNGVAFSGLTGTGATIATQATSLHGSVTNVASAIGYELTSGTAATGTRTVTSSDTAVWGAFSMLLARAAASPIANFTDPFTTFDTTKWTRSDPSDVNAASGFLTLRADPGETQNATSAQSFSLTGSSIYAKFIPVPGTSSAVGQMMLQDASTTDSDFGMRVDSDASGIKTLRMGKRTGVNTTPVWANDLVISYDNVNHQYMRIIEASGTISFQTSDQNPGAGGAWTTRHTLTGAAVPSYVGAVKVYIMTARAGGVTSPINASQFSEMNATVADPTPSPTVNPLSQLSDNFSSQDTAKWNYGSGQGAVGAGKLNIPCTSTEGRLRSRDYWNLEDSFLDLTITPATGGTSPVTSVHLEKFDTAGTAFKVELSGANVVSYGLQTASAWDAGFPLTFTLPAGDRLRIREGAALRGSVPDRIFVDSGNWSAPALSYIWTPRSGSGVASPAWITKNRVILSSKNSAGTSSAGAFDNLNTEDPATVTPVPPITDSFDAATVDTTKWSTYGTPSQVSGNLVLDAVEGIVSQARVNLTGGKQFVNLVDVTTAAGTYSVFRLELTGTNALQFRFEQGVIYAEKIVSGVQTVVGSVTFSTTATKYVQIREAGGQIFFEYGALPGTMSTIGAASANPFPVNSLLVRIERSV